jgi:toxin ParE1/3/4
MAGYSYSDESRVDLESISAFIARDNAAAARRWIEGMREKFKMIVRQPLIGEACDELRPAMRFVVYGNYVVYYTIRKGRIYIVRVVHGAREVGFIFPAEQDNG